jgi:hypothetical protein
VSAGSRLFGLVLLLALGRPAAAETITPLSALFARKSDFSGKTICIQGKTSVLSTKAASRNGNPYFTVWIENGESRIKVFGFGAPKVFAVGDVIEACGRYDQVKKVSNRVFYDEFTSNAIMAGAAMRSGLADVSADGRLALKAAAARSELVQITTNQFQRGPAVSASTAPVRTP